MNAEQQRLEEAKTNKASWKKWGPYLSERQWGTVREDYSEGGDAWNYFPHDHARSRAYQWGEDGLAGISDDKQQLCFALALWNGKDPIVKERLFGLTGPEGNHGEDVKEYYFYLDSTPTHSYMKYLYKYPQAAYPYEDIVDHEPRARPRQTRIRTARHGRVRSGPLLRCLRRIRQGVTGGHAHPDHRAQPRAGAGDASAAAHALVSQRLVVGRRRGPPDGAATGAGQDRCDRGAFASQTSASASFAQKARRRLLFTENETNTERLFATANASPYVKDGINNFLVHGNKDAVNPDKQGTKVTAHYPLTLGAGESRTIRLRLSDQPVKKSPEGARRLFRQGIRVRVQDPHRGSRCVLRHDHSRLAAAPTRPW